MKKMICAAVSASRLPYAAFLLGFLLFAIHSNGRYKERVKSPSFTFKVTIETVDDVSKDSVYLFLTDAYFSAGNTKIYPAARGKDGLYCFVIHTAFKRGQFSMKHATPPGHFNDGSVYQYLPFISSYEWEAGDDIKFTLTRRNPNHLSLDFRTDYLVKISGKGVAKYEAWENLHHLVSPQSNMVFTADSTDYTYVNWKEPRLMVKLAALEKERYRITPYYYQLYKAMFLCDMGHYSHYYWTNKFWETTMAGKTPEERDKFRQTYLRYDEKLDTLVNSIPDTVATQSKEYILFLYNRMRFSFTLRNGKMNLEELIKYIQHKYHGEIRDKILLASLEKESGNEKISFLFKDSFGIIKNEECKKEMERIALKIPGYPVYNFKLPDTKGNYIRMSDFKGSVVFIDFWFTGCGACQGYYNRTLKGAEELLIQNKDVKFISICVDRAKAYWLKSVRSGEYTADLAVNLYTDGEGGYHEMITMYKMNSFPSFMIVDRDGNIHRFYHDQTAPEITSTSALVKTLTDLTGN